ncbi:BlaI/MecI/CopY family transcriptional regulator [Planctomycetota bacterium]
MAKKYQNLGELELEVLKVLWDRGKGSVMQVAETLAKNKGYARTTILIVMQRLLKKGYLKRKKVDGVFQYTPAKKRKQIMGALLTDFIHKVFDGSSTNLVQHLASTDIDDKEFQEIQSIFKQARSED